MYIAQITSHDDGRHLTSAKRGGVSGVASLDANSLQLDAERPVGVSGHIAAAAPHSGHDISSYQTYVGDNGINKAVAHGLGRVPKELHCGRSDAGAMIHGVVAGKIGMVSSGGSDFIVTVTNWDDVNVYLGDGVYHIGNALGLTYYLVVIA